MSETEEYHICSSFEDTFAILGKKWNGMIIQVLLRRGPQRFTKISSAIQKCSDKVLTDRLRELEQDDIIVRKCEGKHTIYSLTQRGEELRPVMEVVHKWADKWCDSCK